MSAEQNNAQLERLRNAIADAYAACNEKDATIPSDKIISGLAACIRSIQHGIPDGYVKPTETINITSNVSNKDITNGKWLNVNVPVGITPIGNLTDALITRSSSNGAHVATIPAGYYVNNSFSISEWKSGQLQGSGTNGKGFSIPYTSIGFIPKWVVLCINASASSGNSNATYTVLFAVSTGSVSNCVYRQGSSSVTSNTSMHATINSSGVTFPAPASNVKFSSANYRWFAMR